MNEIVNNYNTSYFKYKISQKGTSGIVQNDMLSLPEKLTKFLSDVEKTTDYNSYWETINRFLEENPNAKINENKEIKFGEYIIKPSMDIDAEYDKSVLSGLKKKGISMAPEFLTCANNKEGFAVSVLKIDGTKNCNLIDYHKGYSLLTDESKQEAYKDLKKLLKLGIVNKAIFNGNALKINPDTKKIICTNWQDLCPIEEYDKGMQESARMNVMTKIFEKLFNNK